MLVIIIKFKLKKAARFFAPKKKILKAATETRTQLRRTMWLRVLLTEARAS